MKNSSMEKSGTGQNSARNWLAAHAVGLMLPVSNTHPIMYGSSSASVDKRFPRFTNQQGVQFVKNDKYFGMRATIGILLALHRVRYYLSHRICARTICTK